MHLPNVIADLVNAQANYDSVASATCFSQTALVIDEGKTHHGRSETQAWIAEANKKYKSVLKPLHFTQQEQTSILTAEVSGSFAASPIVLNYHFELTDGLIQMLKVTG